MLTGSKIPPEFEQAVRQVLGKVQLARDQDEDISSNTKRQAKQLGLRISTILRTTSRSDQLLQGVYDLSARSTQHQNSIEALETQNAQLASQNNDLLQRLDRLEMAQHSPGKLRRPGTSSSVRAGLGTPRGIATEVTMVMNLRLDVRTPWSVGMATTLILFATMSGHPVSLPVSYYHAACLPRPSASSPIPH